MSTTDASPSTSPFRLDGRVALVTGGNRGIGLGIARGLAEAGATVVIAGRDAERGAEAVEELMAFGGEVGFVQYDALDETSGPTIVAATVAKFGKLDILVNNAGINIRKPPQDYSVAEWHSVIETNLTSVFLLSQAAYPELLRAGGGKIINIGSLSSHFGLPFAAPYSSSKGAIVQLTKSLAVSWAKDGIQVNAILPGWIDTDLTVRARKDVDGLEERVVLRTPAGRWGKPKDLAGLAVFLAGEASDFINGVAITVDGGYSAQG